MTLPERVLIAVITGGRPKVSDRPTEKFLPTFAALGDVEYVVREDQASGYELTEGYGLNTYSVPWADSYARAHWRHPKAVFTPGGFHGAFTGREWVMRTAEERGYGAVLQLDDNISSIAPVSAPRAGNYSSTDQLAMVTAMLNVLMSTNIMMLGMQLSAVVPKDAPTVRVGFPYSIFWEKTGPGRMPYYGPFEDDIMHAMEYGLNGGTSRTVGLVPLFTYKKESKSKTGMRKHYNAERGLELPRRYPRNARLKTTRKTASPTDTGVGVRHSLNTRGFTPIRVTDRDRFLKAQSSIQAQVQATDQEMRRVFRAKIQSRAGVVS